MKMDELWDLLTDETCRFRPQVLVANDMLSEQVLNKALDGYARRWTQGESFLMGHDMALQRVCIYGVMRPPINRTMAFRKPTHPIGRTDTPAEIDALLEICSYHIRDLAVLEWGKKVSRRRMVGFIKTLLSFENQEYSTARIYVDDVMISADELVDAWNAAHPDDKTINIDNF